MTVEQNLYLEISEKIVNPILLLIAGFYFGNKSKKVDVDIQKTKELNIVLSNMLNSWYYLNRLSELQYFQDIEDNNLLFPKQYLPFILLKSGTLNDNCFQELEMSIESLKQYEPISYFELEGIGKKFEFIKSNYILPFLKQKKSGLISNNMNRAFLDKLLNDIELHLRETAKQISKKTLRKIEKKIEITLKNDLDKLKENFNYEYYEMILTIIPKNEDKPTYEEFIFNMKNPEVQNNMQIQFDYVVKNGMDKLISLIVENPDLSIEELEQKIKL